MIADADPPNDCANCAGSSDCERFGKGSGFDQSPAGGLADATPDAIQREIPRVRGIRPKPFGAAPVRWGETMKRTATAFMLVAGAAGIGGCVAPDATKNQQTLKPVAQTTQARVIPGVMGSTGEPVARAQGAARPMSSRMTDGGVVQAGAESRYPPETYGPMQSFAGSMAGRGGILPAPGQSVPGAVAGIGFGGPMGGMGAYTGMRTSIRFASPAGMKIAFMDPNKGFSEAGREAPVRFNFPQSNVYRIRLSGIPTLPATKNYYPTLEVYPSTPKTMTFLSHSAVPVGFTNEDFEQVNAGNLVVKVIYLPDPQFQDLAAAEEIVSTRLEAGVDPVAEANRRGTILAVIRIGNIDLEDPTTPAMDAPPGMGLPSPRMAPQMTPPILKPLPAPGSSSKTPDSLPKLTVPVIK